MLNRKKIPAFTMMDILTGMVIMSIVIAMVFYLMSATNGQAYAYQKIRIELNDYMLMKADLKRQAEAAQRIEAVPNGFQLISENGMIEYIKSDNHFIRKSENSVDTLYDNISELVLINADPVAGQPSRLNSLITGVSVKLKFEDQILSCYLYKDYGLTAPLNQQLFREF